MNAMNVYVDADGLLMFIYDDELHALQGLGNAQIARASHVEPTPLGWTADMSPSGGGLLGPFAKRTEAIGAEVNWIERSLKSLVMGMSHPTESQPCLQKSEPN